MTCKVRELDHPQENVEKSDDHPQGDLAKSGYKPDMKNIKKKFFFNLFAYTMKTKYKNLVIFYFVFPSLLAIEFFKIKSFSILQKKFDILA